MAWASVSRDATWLSRMRSLVIYPAEGLYLNWPTGVIRATTHNKTLTDGDANEWKGVGNVAWIKKSAHARDSARIRYTVGLKSLPIDNVDDDLEAAAIGRRAILYSILFDSAWKNPVFEPIFTGHVQQNGKLDFRRDGKRWLLDASITIANGRHPRRQLQNHHSPETAEAGDTAMRLLPTAGRPQTWPSN